MLLDYLDKHPDEFSGLMAGAYALGEAKVEELLIEAQRAGKRLDFYYDLEEEAIDKIEYRFI